MREILFRGKDIIDGEWIYGFYSLLEGHACIYSGKLVCSDMPNLGDVRSEVIPATVGQYTGLKDKNGERIFDGDIVRLYSDYHGHVPVKGYAKVTFSYEYNGGWVVISNDEDRMCLSIHTDIVEKISNIHDNPELLEAL